MLSVKRAVLFSILAVFAVFVYYASFRGMVIWPLILMELPLVAVYYAISSVVTEGMIRKQRGSEKFMYAKASMIAPDSTTLIPGALTITPSDIIFYTRKKASGGVQVSWSCSSGSISEYSLGKVDGFHKGLSLTLSGQEEPVKFVSGQLQGKDADLKDALGWNGTAE